MLTGKNVLLGVTGGIAAYKAVEVASRLRKLGALVHVIMTEAATRLVAPLTFQAISANPVLTDLLGEPKHGSVEHIHLAREADLLLVAPCTADVMGKLAHGLATDFLTTVALAVTCPVLICPAMETQMWRHPAVRENRRRLEALGYRVLDPGSGFLASGGSGEGRLPEPLEIAAAALLLLAGEQQALQYVQGVEGEWAQVIARARAPRRAQPQDLAGRRVLVTAGPTREAVDPVRYLSNRSSGKMGFAVAAAARERGADVHLVTGPAHLADPPGVRVTRVESAQQMYEAAMQAFAASDIVVGAAAVADFRPKAYAAQKIKKGDRETYLLELEKTVDILAAMGKQKRPGQVLVGFAAETRNIVEYAREKLVQKNLDLVVANDVSREGAGFSVDTNIVTVVGHGHLAEDLPLMSKEAVAHAIWDRVAALLQ